VGIEPIPCRETPSAEAFLDIASGALISAQGSEGATDLTPNMGGWAQFGFSQDGDD